MISKNKLFSLLVVSKTSWFKNYTRQFSPEEISTKIQKAIPCRTYSEN